MTAVDLVSRSFYPEDGNDQKTSIRSSASIAPFFPHTIPLWKRFMDIFGAIFGLILLSPLILVISIFIKMVSSGPVLFTQERIGRGGKPFQFFKFRTMKQDSDTSMHRAYLSSLIKEELKDDHCEHPMLKRDSKWQIIPFGSFLRKSCLDELPQLINVLKGEMSLVGPRPPIPYEAKEYLQWHNGRFDCLPGMTGLWQVSGKNNLSFKEMVRLDIRYLKNVSLWLDTKIFLTTPFAIISNIKGGYLQH